MTLNIVSSDVAHSWWIPALGGKFQAVPGYHNYTWFKIAKPGVYPRSVREHVRPWARPHDRDRRAIPPAQFDAWLADQKRLIGEANAAAAAERKKLSEQTGPGQVENP